MPVRTLGYVVCRFVYFESEVTGCTAAAVTHQAGSSAYTNGIAPHSRCGNVARSQQWRETTTAGPKLERLLRDES